MKSIKDRLADLCNLLRMCASPEAGAAAGDAIREIVRLENQLSHQKDLTADARKLLDARTEEALKYATQLSLEQAFRKQTESTATELRAEIGKLRSELTIARSDAKDPAPRQVRVTESVQRSTPGAFSQETGTLSFVADAYTTRPNHEARLATLEADVVGIQGWISKRL